MAYISNSTRNTGPLSKYGGTDLNMPGSTVKAPQTKGTTGVVWGIPQANNYQFPMPSFNTANSTPATAQPPAPITRSGDTSYTPPKTTTDGSTSGYVAPTTGYTSPTNTSGGWTDAQRSQLNDIIAGVGNLQSAFDSYKKGLVPTPTAKKKEDQPRNNTSQFGQFTEGLLNRQKPSKEQQRYLRQMERQAVKGEEIGRRAAELSDMYGNEIARVGRLGAGAVAGAQSTGTDVVGRGNAAIASQSASNRISALGAAQAAALQGTAQQLTGSQQGIDAFNNALTGANTQQQIGIQALQAGGQLAMPSPAAYGQTVFDPVTGQYTGGQLDPNMQAQQLAQQVMSGAMTYDQALAAMNYTPIGTNALMNAVTGVGGNPLALQAQNAAQQANIATAGTAETNVALTGYDNATQTYMNMVNFKQAASQQAQDLLNVMNTINVNNQPLLRANTAINKIAEETNDPGVKAFQVALQEAQALYQRLLFAGTGTPTGVEQRALAVLDGSATPQVTAAAIQQLENAAGNMLRAQEDTMNTFRGMINAGGGGTQSRGGQPTGPITWDMILDI